MTQKQSKIYISDNISSIHGLFKYADCEKMAIDK